VADSTTFFGLDVHKDSITVALYLPGEKEPVEWKEGNTEASLRRLTRRLKKRASGQLQGCYEAGGCGYAVQRTLAGHGVKCQVVAPSLIPKKPGERVKTDRRDARKLGQLLRAGMLTEVQPPTPEQEADRDLVRAREDALDDRMRARHRLSKFLLRRGIKWTGRSNWTVTHMVWLQRLKFEHASEQEAFDGHLTAVQMASERLSSLTQAIELLAQEERYREPVGALRCLRGIDTLSAMVVLTELLGVARFESPRQLMAYLGLTPSEHSSGNQATRGGITKTGNRYVRRILVEAAWHYRHQPRASKTLLKRRRGQPSWAVAMAEKAQKRLSRRFWKLILSSNKSPKVAATAVARELAGVIWAMLMKLEQGSSASTRVSPSA
jgi:transposase